MNLSSMVGFFCFLFFFPEFYLIWWWRYFSQLKYIYWKLFQWDFGSDSKVSAYNVGDPGSIPGLGRSGEGNGNPLQYSSLENPMDGGTWQATVHGVTKSQIGLSYFTFTFFHFLSLSLFFSISSIWGSLSLKISICGSYIIHNWKKKEWELLLLPFYIQEWDYSHV